MNLEVGDVVTLTDDNEYAVALTTTLDNKKILFLTDINNEGNVKFGYEDGNEFVEVKDEEEIKKYVLALNVELKK